MSINNRRSTDDCKDDDEVTEIHRCTEGYNAIDQLISARPPENIEQCILTQVRKNIGQADTQETIITDVENEIPVTNNNELQCIEIQPSGERHLPNDIIILFPCDSEQTITNLKKAQHIVDNTWEEIDTKYETVRKSRTIVSQMREQFKIKLESYLKKEFPTQVKSVKKALWMLNQSSYGILFYNTDNEVLAVQNYYGTWSAIKGHRKIKGDGTLETSWETCVRELFEELQVKLKRSKRDIIITEENIHLLVPNNIKFLQCYVDSEPNTNDKSRLIGLFCGSIDKNKWKFSLKDYKENQACKWLKMNDIISNIPEQGHDVYYTLRPFVKHLKDTIRC